MIRHPEAPPPGESPEAAYNDFERRYAALDLAALAVMVGADNDDARDHFDRALSSALSDFHLQLREGNALTRRQLRAELEAVENRATALLAALNALHYDAWMEMLDGYEQRVTEDFDEERWLQEGLSFADVQWDVAADSISRLRDVAAEAREQPRAMARCADMANRTPRSLGRPFRDAQPRRPGAREGGLSRRAPAYAPRPDRRPLDHPRRARWPRTGRLWQSSRAGSAGGATTGEGSPCSP